MSMRVLAEIRSIPIASAGFTPQMRNWLVEDILNVRVQEGLEETNHVATEGRIKRSKIYTIGDFIDLDREKYRHLLSSDVLDRFCKRLVELGLNHFDWDVLPPKTVTEMLHTRTKKEILALDVRVLDALSHKALGYIAYPLLKDASGTAKAKITVADLVEKITFSQLTSRSNTSFAISYFNAKKKLESLGFRYEDGPFFQEGSARKAAEDLAAKRGMGYRRALSFVRVAFEEGWIKLPLEEK